MAQLLAIESTASGCSVAVLRHDAASPDALLAYRALPASRGQADRLVELIEAAIGDAGLAYGELDLVAVDHGPGSFTGVRTGVAAARGLALAADLPVLPVSSLETVAGAARPAAGEVVVAAQDARRGEVYAQAFDARRRPQSPPQAIAPERAAAGLAGPVWLAGSGAPLIRAHLPDGAKVTLAAAEPDARLVARAAVRRLVAGARPIAGFDLQPLYLRAPDARLPDAALAAAPADALP
jgi:tRNA threonylcarbamoyladenosine biosynthesis protein TsaB